MEKTFEQVYMEHIAFTSKTFPKGTSIGALLHAEREIEEVRQDIINQKSGAEKAIEYADIIGCIMDSANREGIGSRDIIKAWDNKLQINKSRAWKDNGDGSYSHIK